MARFVLSFLLFWGLLGLESCLAFDFIIDPGHSPSKPGTYSCSGGAEYVYNERLVETIVRYLYQQGLRVDLTRQKNGEISLQQRAAKSSGKKLFLSIHHDSAHPKYIKMIKGYPCSNKAYGYSIFVSAKNPYFERSFLYARVLGKMLRAQGLTPSTHHGEPIKGENRHLLDAEAGIYQFDDLIVLKQAKSPAILLEAAVIINPEDDARAKNLNYQLKIAQAIGQMFLFAKNAPLK